MSNVVPFRTQGGGRPRSSEERLACVIAAMQALGEPATLDELADIILRAGLWRTSNAHEEIRYQLDYNCVHPRPGEAAPVFRKVSLWGGEAFAFTASFRRQMTAAGHTLSLRLGASDDEPPEPSAR